MNAFLLDIQRKNDININSTPRVRKYQNPGQSTNHIFRIFILHRQIPNRINNKSHNFNCQILKIKLNSIFKDCFLLV
jgi:hypothetical protein